MSSATVYQQSPFGAAQHPWLTKADTKYNDDGVFKLGLAVGGEEAVTFAAKVDGAASAALERFFESEDGKKIKPADRKHWKAYSPYSHETDDEGVPTGYTVFRFKQNAKLKLKDGTVKLVKIAVMDASGKKEVTKPVFGGSELRVSYTFRDVVIKTAKEVGVQLAFGRVQVKKLAESNGGGSGFDAVEGYEEQDDEQPSQHKPDASSTDGDY